MDWQITKIEISPRNGKYYVHGINHCTTDPLFREFYWHVDKICDRFFIKEEIEIPEAVARLLDRDGVVLQVKG